MQSGARPNDSHARWSVAAAAEESVRSHGYEANFCKGVWRCVCRRGGISGGYKGRREGEGRAYLEFFQRGGELDWAPGDDGDVRAAVCELAGKREAEAF